MITISSKNPDRQKIIGKTSIDKEMSGQIVVNWHICKTLPVSLQIRFSRRIEKDIFDP